MLDTIRDFIYESFSFDEKNVTYDLDLAQAGIVDSVTMVKVIIFLEKQFHVSFDDSDLHPDNFYTIRSMANLVEKKMNK